jgi:hypothetical protein
MTDDLNGMGNGIREEDFDEQSLFPPDEPPSICTRPTPLVPARRDLLGFRSDSLRPGFNGSSSAPAPSPSSRPTLTPEDLGISSPLDSAVAASGSLAPAFEPNAPPVEPSAPPLVEIGPLVSLEPAALSSSEPVRPERPRWRVIFARVLFTVLFGCVAALLAYAFRAQLGDALGEARVLTGL